MRSDQSGPASEGDDRLASCRAARDGPAGLPGDAPPMLSWRKEEENDGELVEPDRAGDRKQPRNRPGNSSRARRRRRGCGGELSIERERGGGDLRPDQGAS